MIRLVLVWFLSAIVVSCCFLPRLAAVPLSAGVFPLALLRMVALGGGAGRGGAQCRGRCSQARSVRCARVSCSGAC